MTRRAIVLPICASIALFASSAAADPTKQECVAANESAQDLQRLGKLREARASLAVCTAASCPGAVREDCGQRLKDVEAALPRLVFEAKDAAGHDLIAVRVTMDGETLLEKLDGSATVVDPGEHHFAFEAEGFRKSESTLLVREGEMDRPVRVVLVSTAAPTGPQPVESGGVFDAGTRRALGITLGIAGLGGVAVGAVFGLLAKSTYDQATHECQGDVHNCMPTPPVTLAQGSQDTTSASNQATVSTIAFIAGGALVAVGTVLFISAPTVTTGEVAIAPSVTNQGGGFVLRGKW